MKYETCMYVVASSVRRELDAVVGLIAQNLAIDNVLGVRLALSAGRAQDEHLDVVLGLDT